MQALQISVLFWVCDTVLSDKWLGKLLTRIMKTEAADSSEAFITTYKTIRCHSLVKCEPSSLNMKTV
jgi:hypothetical protein